MADNIYLNLAKARIEVQKQCTKKSGRNKFAGFDYFELKDFLTTATNELAKVGLVALFNIKQTVNEQGIAIEQPTLTITDGTNSIDFVSPSADVNVKGANDIQNLGSKHTYLKRYLYLNALELSEADGVDATIGNDKPKEDKPMAKATPKQIEIIKAKMGNDRINNMLAHYGHTKLEELTVAEASECIGILKKEVNNGTN